MKKFLSIISSLIVASSVTTVLANNVNNSVVNNNITHNNYDKNQINNNIKTIKSFEQTILSKNISEQNQLKDNLISAIKLADNKIILDTNKLNKQIWNQEIYQWITSENYTKQLNQLFQLNLLSFNKANLHFNNSYLLGGRNGVWTESHWYWFGYWYLYLGHDVCDTLKNSIQSPAAFISELVAAGLALEIAIIVVPFLLVSWLATIAYDHGNGIWICLYAAVPVGMGSN